MDGTHEPGITPDADALKTSAALGEVRTDWTLDEVRALFDLPFNDLLFAAQSAHRRHFDPNAVQISTLLSIKTGGCPEDCSYCPQSVRFETVVENEPLMAARDCGRAGEGGQGPRRNPVLHGRRLSLAQAETAGANQRRWWRPSATSAWKPAPRSAC